MSLNDAYGLRANGKRHGDVFTLPEVVNYMLDIAGYIPDKNLSQVSILEPACGDGEFVLEILRRLSKSAKLYNFDFNEAAHSNIYAYEIDHVKIDVALHRINELCLDLENPPGLIKNANFLTANHLPAAVDIVVGNPPYVRYEQLPEDVIDFCKRSFDTFHYRADLYVPFYEKTLRMLKAGGKHCFICSDRWLRNEYGKKLRKLVADKFNIECIIDLKRVNPFQEKVSAYTSIVLLSKMPKRAYFSYSSIHGLSDLGNAKIMMKPSPRNDDWSCSFVGFDSCDNLYGIEEFGLKIGIGVATGADSVFISKDLPQMVEKELLLPLITGRELRGNSMRSTGLYILNPFNPDGSLIDLSQYPRAAAYLQQHKEKLEKRHVAKKSPQAWYRTIDKINPGLIGRPKILLPDMSANTFIFVDAGAFYPAHNLYYITGSDVRNLELLSAILMSKFVTCQLSSIANTMNGGFVRWQSQYLHKLRIPNLFDMDVEASELLDAYHKHDLAGIDTIVERILRRTIDYGTSRSEGFQLPLFFDC